MYEFFGRAIYKFRGVGTEPSLPDTFHPLQGDRKGPRVANPSSRRPHQGDRKGPHSAPLRPRPYNDDEQFFIRRVSW